MTSVATGKLVSSSGLSTCSVFFYEMATQVQPQEEADERLKKKKKGTNFLYSGDMTHHKGPQRSTGSSGARGQGQGEGQCQGLY